MPGDHFTILQKVGALHVLDHLGAECVVIGSHSGSSFLIHGGH